MATHSYTAVRGAGSWSVTRSTTDGLSGGIAHFSFDDTTVVDKLALRELWQTTLNRLGENLRGVSKLAHLGGAGLSDYAFSDDANYADGALFSDQGAGLYTLQGSIDNDGEYDIVASTDNAIGSADSVLILASGATKLDARNAVLAIAKALHADSLSFSSPASYPTS